MCCDDRWFDQRQIEALVMGKFVADKEEVGSAAGGVTVIDSIAQSEAQSDGDDDDDGDGDGDSPPPTDLNSFLESV